MDRLLQAQAVLMSWRLDTQVCSRRMAFLRRTASGEVVSTRCMMAAVNAQCTAEMGIRR